MSQLVFRNSMVEVGDHWRVKFWKDNWLDDSALKAKFMIR